MKKINKNTSSMRTAFIRVTAENEVKGESKYHTFKKDDIVTYSFEDIVNKLKDWSQKKKMKYYAIEHIKGKNKHYHIVIDFKDSTAFDIIKKKFPFGDIETCQSVKNSVQYLLRMNEPDEEKYKAEDIVTNDPKGLEGYLKQEEKEEKLKLDDVIRLCSSGIIRRFNIREKIDPVMWAKKKNIINNAFELYEDYVVSQEERDLQVIVFQLPTECRKTSFAKSIAKALGLSFTAGSCQNDIYSTYKGQDVFIINELNDSVFNIDDLKLLFDPENQSTAKSRYYNKAFLGKYIFITTNSNLSGWYSTEDEADRQALFRRFALVLQFSRTGETVTAHKLEYSKEKRCYVKAGEDFEFLTSKDAAFSDIKIPKEADRIGEVIEYFKKPVNS